MTRHATSATRNEGHHIIGLVRWIQTAIGATILDQVSRWMGDRDP
jgi:hypothetical protein